MNDLDKLYQAKLIDQNNTLKLALINILETANAESSGALFSETWSPELIAAKAREALEEVNRQS